MTYNEHLEILKNNPDLVAKNPDVFGKTATPPNNRRVVAEMTTKTQKPINETGRRTKYGVSDSKERTYQGKVYASKHEMLDAVKFAGLVGQGKPYKLMLEQVKIRLPKGESHRVDFAMITWDDKIEWWESKGKDLEAGRIRRHMCEHLFNIEIRLT